MPVTIKDIAARLGISHSTVSRALRGSPHVDEELRRTIRETARELNYRPNALARGLKGMRTQVVGLIIPDLMNDFYATAATIIQAELAKEGYRLLLSVSGNDPCSEHAYLSAMREERVEGLIWVPCSSSPQVLREYAEEGVPVIEFVRRSCKGLDAVLPDDAGGARVATEHLLKLGHTRIGIIGGQRTLSTALGRAKGYLQALQEAGMKPVPELIKVVRFDRESGWQATQELLSLPSPPTALFATSNVLLVGALRALDEHRIRVPEEMSLVGFGNPEWCAFWRPPITTVAFAIEEMAVAAVQTLLKRIRARSTTAHRKPLISRHECRLLVRESTAASPTARTPRPVTASIAARDGPLSPPEGP